MSIGIVLTLLSLGAAPPSPCPEWLPASAVRALGPATMGGRIPTLAVVESNPAIQYVGAASGGLWKTTDDGRTWACVFPGRPHASIGAVAVAPSDPNVVYVGTGEANPRNSVSWGNGVFVSRDAGQTWRHAGLADTHHIGKIVVHPNDPKTAYVAALGHLWGANEQRGLFITKDGGMTWSHSLKLDSDTGCIDVARGGSTLYAAAFRVRRDAFSGGPPAIQFGPRAGIYRSRDEGQTWQRLSRGLPVSSLGRIGLAVSRRDPRLVVAVVPTERTDLRALAGQPPGLGPVETGGIFVSRDSGESWAKVNNLCPRPFYFGKLRIDPNDDQRLYVLGIPLFVSPNGGQSFHADGARGVHVDHHDLWINPNDSRHLILANDGGLYYSRDAGTTWTHVNNLPITQFYAVCADRRLPYHVYGGLQDNGTWGGPSRTANPAGILNEDWKRILGMDGFRCQVPPDDPFTVYAEGQYGQLHRVELPSRTAVLIRPTPRRPNAPTYRFNWSSPLVLSPHHTKTLYFGGNVVFKTVDRGINWYVVSPDLTRGGATTAGHLGHTLTALAESPLRPGLLYAGSDDGLIHVHRPDEKRWSNVGNSLPNVPADGTITCIECSPHTAETVWLSLSRHRQEDRKPYLFRSDDAGRTWTSSVGNLPLEGPIHVVRVDPKHPSVVYVGTEFGLFASRDGGHRWRPLSLAIPTCPIHDLLIHPNEGELIVATHGRGLFVVDRTALLPLSPEEQQQPGYLFPATMGYPARSGMRVQPPARSFQGENPPDGLILWVRLACPIPACVEIVATSERVATRWNLPPQPGPHRLVWPRRELEQHPSPAGYRVRLLIEGRLIQERLVQLSPPTSRAP